MAREVQLVCENGHSKEISIFEFQYYCEECGEKLEIDQEWGSLKNKKTKTDKI